MLRITTLLIVASLAGGPGGSLACELWCASPVAEPHQRAVGCHNASQPWPTGQQIVSDAGCYFGAAVAPFVTQARTTESGYSAHAAASALVPFHAMRNSDAVIAGWFVFDAQASRAPWSRAVLRI